MVTEDAKAKPEDVRTEVTLTQTMSDGESWHTKSSPVDPHPFPFIMQMVS